MPNRSITLLLAFVLGCALAFALVPVTARTAAIVAPKELFLWFRGHGLLPLALFTWDTIVVHGLSIAVPAAVALVLFFRWSSANRTALALCLSAGVLLSAYWLVPYSFGAQAISPLSLPWWQHGLVAALAIAFGIAIGVSRLFRITIRSSGRL